MNLDKVKPTIFLAPSHTWGRAYLRDQARRQGLLAGVKVAMPDELILELARPHLGVVEPLGAMAGAWAAEAALKDALKAGKIKSFRCLLAQESNRVPDYPNLGAVLFQLLDRLRRQGWDGAALKKAAPKGSEDKFIEIAELLEAWTLLLAGECWADWKKLRDLATKSMPQASKLLGASRLRLCGAWPWDSATTEFILELGKALKTQGGEVIVEPAPIQDPPAGLPKHLKRLGANLPKPTLQDHPLAFALSDFSDPLPAEVTASWDFLCGSSASAELREDLRRALAKEDTRLDQVVVYSANTQAHQSAARGLETALDVPATLGVSRPHAGLACAEGLRALARWARGGQQFSELILGLRQGWLHAEHPWMLADDLEALGLGFGWQRAKPEMLTTLREYWASRPDDHEKMVIEDERFNRLRDFCAVLLKGFPDPGQPVAMDQLAHWLREAGDRLTHSRLEEEGKEKAALLGALSALRRASKGHQPYPMEDACRLLGESLDEVKKGGEASKPGAWHLATLGSPVEPGRDVVILAGLDSGTFPGTLQPDPFLTETELVALNLPTAEDRVQERLTLALQAFCGLGRPRKLIVSWQGADMDEARPKAPSSLVLQLYRLKYGPEADYRTLEISVGDPLGPLPLDPVLALSLLELEAGNFPLVKEMPEPFWKALEARRSDKSTPWDGLGKPVEGLDFLAKPWSPSGLEALLECPRRSIYERFLYLKPAEEAGEIPDEWLDANEAGTLLHSFYEWALTQETWPDKKAIQAKMNALFKEWELRAPPPSVAIAKTRQEKLMEEALAFKDFLDKALPEGWSVAATEIEFGQSGDAPLVLDLGKIGKLKLRGRVDLVLKKGVSRSIWDYKTGSSKYHPEKTEELLANGMIQVPAYVAAMQALADAQGGKEKYVGGGYLFPTFSGGYARHLHDMDAPFAKEALKAIVQPALEALARGDWRVGEACGFCELQAACDARQAIAKQGRRRKAEKAMEEAQAGNAPKGKRK